MGLSRWPGGSRITAEGVFELTDEATRQAPKLRRPAALRWLK